jgi:hypothetical protein
MQIVLTILFYIFVAVFICCAIVVINISLVHKSLLCSKFYTFFFEHDDWILYRKAKKQGIQHYLNGCHFSQFYDEWHKVQDQYGIVDGNFTDIDEKVADELLSKHDELAEKYHYREYDEVNNRINDDDIVLSLNMYSEQLYIGVGNIAKNLLNWEPMVKDIIKSQVTKDRVFYALLADPKMVVSF